jgi:hypothetical protein
MLGTHFIDELINTKYNKHLFSKKQDDFDEFKQSADKNEGSNYFNDDFIDLSYPLGKLADDEINKILQENNVSPIKVKTTDETKQ